MGKSWGQEPLFKGQKVTEVRYFSTIDGFRAIPHTLPMPRPHSTEAISNRQLVKCSRCGAPDLCWVTYKSGKHGLVQTALHSNGRYQEPTLVACRFQFHNCAEYTQVKTEIERRNSQCHPKADQPAKILADALHHIIDQIVDTPNGLETLNEKSHPLTQAFEILLAAQSSIPNLEAQ